MVVEVWRSADPSALEAAVLPEYVAALEQARLQRSPGTTLWLTPTVRAAQTALKRLMSIIQRSCWSPGVVTFEAFAEDLLHAAGRPADAISPTVRRLLLRRLTAAAVQRGDLVHFQPVATTSGFLDVLEGFIAELKRDEIWPEDFLRACQPQGRLGRRDCELGQLYGSYQAILQLQNWYDAAGRMWLARSALTEGQCRRLPQWSLIVISGFSDLTRTQFDLVEQLARRTTRLVITLPGEPGSERRELFQRAHATLDELQQRCGAVAVRWIQNDSGAADRGPPEDRARSQAASRRTPNDGARGEARKTTAEKTPTPQPSQREPAFRAALRTGLFVNPRRWTPRESGAGLTIIAATGPDSEIRAVALRIKHLLRSGVGPEAIAVGVRDVHEAGRVWTAGLQDSGLPVSSDVGPPLREHWLLKLIVTIWQNELEDWPFTRLLTVLDAAVLSPPPAIANLPGGSRAVSLALRRLRLGQDRGLMLRQLEHTAQQPSRGRIDPETLESIDDDLPQLAATAVQWLRWYDAATSLLRQDRSLGEWLDVLAELFARLGISSAWATLPPTVPKTAPLPLRQAFADRRAWERLQGVLRDAATAEQRLDGPPQALTAAEFLQEIRDLVSAETLEPDDRRPGTIPLLAMDQLRHLDTPHLFLVGLTEDSFPRRRSDDCLFTDAEREQLAARGLPLRHAAIHQQDEASFFATVLLRAQATLTLSYAAVDGRGQPTFPSPFVVAVRSLYTAAAVPLVHEGQLDPILPADHAVTAADTRLIALEAAARGEFGWLRTLGEAPPTAPMVTNLVNTLRMAAARFQTTGFTGYEGRLELPANREALARRFHSARQFSATEFEAYATCPFRFWLAHVLRIEPLSPPNEGTDHLRRGIVVHSVLADLLQDGPRSLVGTAIAERFRTLVSERLDRKVGLTDLQQALTRVEQRLLDRWADAFATQYSDYAAHITERWQSSWNAAPPELAFGDVPRHSGDEPDSTAPPLAFGRSPRQVLVRGRIDRIDYGTIEGRTVYTVIDYKTGRPPRFSEADVASGRAVQLVLYTLAVQRLGLLARDAIPFQLGYWCLKETGFRANLKAQSRQPLPPLDLEVWKTLEALLDETLPRLAEGIRQGDFRVENSDSKCQALCDYRTVCRVNQLRAVAVDLQKRSAGVGNSPSETNTSPSTEASTLATRAATATTHARSQPSRAVPDPATKAEMAVSAADTKVASAKAPGEDAGDPAAALEPKAPSRRTSRRRGERS